LSDRLIRLLGRPLLVREILFLDVIISYVHDVSIWVLPEVKRF